jgi:hypothetical protein
LQRRDASPEVRRRAARLVDRLAHPTRKQLRTARAVAVLEYMNSDEGADFLRVLAGGAQGAWLTHESLAARERLARFHAHRMHK